MSREYYVYIMTNDLNTVTYTGVTNDLERRVYEHKNRVKKGFTTKYYISKLVFFENTDDISAAIMREKEIKGWVRRKKVKLTENTNPDWKDLSSGWFDE